MAFHGVNDLSATKNFVLRHGAGMRFVSVASGKRRVQAIPNKENASQ
jgi:hypothetical protein